MSEVTVSTKYQVVIPKEIRQQVNLTPGQKLQVVVKGSMITMIPLYPVQAIRGMLEGMDTSGFREEEERV